MQQIITSMDITVIDSTTSPNAITTTAMVTPGKISLFSIDSPLATYKQ